MKNALTLEVEFLPTDRFSIDGESYRFLGASDRGYVFVSDVNGDTFREILDIELLDLVCDPGRFSLEPEFFKKRGPRK